MISHSKFVPLILATILDREQWLSSSAQSGVVLVEVKGHRFLFKESPPENTGYILMPQGIRGYDPKFGKLSIELNELAKSKRPLHNKHESLKVNRIPTSVINLEVFRYDMDLDNEVTLIKKRRNKFLLRQRAQIVVLLAVSMLLWIAVYFISPRLPNLFEVFLFTCCLIPLCIETITCIRLLK